MFHNLFYLTRIDQDHRQMFESPVGRIHQASRRMNNQNPNGNRNPFNGFILNPSQNAPLRISLTFNNYVLPTDLDSTIHQERQQSESYFHSTVSPPNFQEQNRQEFFQDTFSRVNSFNSKPVSKLFRNAENKFVPEERLMEVENIRPTRIMRNNNEGQMPRRQNRSVSPIFFRRILNVNQINQSQTQGINLINQQAIPQQNNFNENDVNTRLRFNQSEDNSSSNDRNHINLIDQNRNQNNHDYNYDPNQTATPLILRHQQNNQQNLSQVISNKPKENSPVLEGKEFSYAQSPKKNNISSSVKNNCHSKKNRHNFNKVKLQRRNAQIFTLNNEHLFKDIEAPFHQSKFPYLTPQMIEQINRIIQINTKSQQFQKLIRTPNQLLSYKLIEYLVALNDFKKISKANAMESHQEVLMRKLNPQNIQQYQMKLTPFDQLKLQYGPINVDKRNQQVNQRILDSNFKIFQKQIRIMQKMQMKEGSLIKFLEQSEILRIQKEQKMRHAQQNQQKNYYQRVNLTKNLKYQKNPTPSKNKNQSSNQNTTASKKSHFSGKKNLEDQLPKVSEFNISPFDKPYDKKYVLTLDNYEIGKLKWFWMKLKYGVKNQYCGEVQFQRYPSQIKVNDAIIRDIFKRQEILFEFFKDSRSTVEQYGLKKWFSPAFDLQLEGLLIFPLQLQLPQGYDYLYTYYSGNRISSLVIYNKFAKVSFIEDVFIKEKCEKERDLRHKIRFDNEGIWIGCQMLKRKCKFTYQGTQQKLEQFLNPDLSEDDISKKILPLNKDGTANKVHYDTVNAPKLYGQIQWKDKPIEKKSNGFNFLLISLTLLIISIVIVQG